MARFREMINNFLGGEVSPRVFGRTDLDGFKNTCETLENFIPVPQGGALRRSGTIFVSDDAFFIDTVVSQSAGVPIDSNDIIAREAFRMFPFVASNGRRFIIMFTSATSANAVRIWDVTNAAIVTPDIAASASGYIYFIGRVLSENEIQSLQSATYGNAVFFAFADGTEAPFAIEYNTTSGNFYLRDFWRFSQIGIDNNSGTPTGAQHADAVAYAPTNASSVTMTISTASVGTGRTLTASAATFTSNMVGTLIRVGGDSAVTTGVARITAYTSTTQVTVAVIVAFEDTNPTTTWALQAWSPGLGWPKSVTVFENRLYYGGNTAYPNRFWASKIGRVDFFRQEKYYQETPYPGVTNDMAFDFALASEKVANIKWMSPGKTLQIGTDTREFIAYGPDGAEALGPLNVNVSAESAYGSCELQPVRISNTLLFIPRSRRLLREFVYNFQEDSYKADNLMTLVEHLPQKILDQYSVLEVPYLFGIAHQEYDNGVTWCWDRSGGAFTMTRDRELGVLAFARHKFGGRLVDQETNAIQTYLREGRPALVAACTLPNSSGDHDDLWVLVRRTIGDNNVNYLERMERPFERETIWFGGASGTSFYPIFVDSAVVQQGSTLESVWSNLDHLEGETVQVVGDGSYLGEYVVSSGDVDLGDIECYSTVIGLGYRSLIKTANINAGGVLGSSQNVMKTVDDVAIRFSKTIGGKIGIDLDTLEDLPDFRPYDLNMDEPIPLFTGDKIVTFPEGWETKFNIYIVQDLPLPMCVDSIMMRGISND
jgi:hypothetical protein